MLPLVLDDDPPPALLVAPELPLGGADVVDDGGGVVDDGGGVGVVVPVVDVVGPDDVGEEFSNSMV